MATSTDEHGNAVVTTTLVVRNVVTNEVFKKSTRETRAQVSELPPVASPLTICCDR